MADAEVLAVSKIENVLALTDWIKSYVRAGDRFPSYDGDLCIQPHGDSKKDLAIVGVQIKGRFAVDVAELEGDSATYQADVTDLENYERNGGVLFFCSIASGSDQRVFYNSLVPMKLRRLLEEANGQATKSITLEPLPEDPVAVEEVVLNHYSDMKKQFSFCDMGPSGSKPRVFPPGSRYAMHYTSLAPNEYEAFEHVLGKELSVYVESEDFPIPVPTGDSMRVTELARVHDRQISVRGEAYYDTVIEEITQDGRVLKMGGIEVSRPRDGECGKISFVFDSNGSFRERLKSLRFLSASIADGGFEVGGSRVDVATSNARKAFDEGGFAGALRFYEDTADALDALGDDSDFRMGGISGLDRRNVAILKKGLVQKELIEYADDGFDSAICSIHLFGRHYLILHERRGANLYEISDFVSKELDTARIYEDSGEVFRITKYGYAPPEEYLDVANLKPRDLVESCKTAGYNGENCGMANEIGLALVSRFDEQGSIEDLQAAAELFAWLASPENAFVETIYAINDLQVKYRMGGLSEADATAAKKMIEEDRATLRRQRVVTAACRALLGDAKGANSSFRSLNKSERERLEKRPIGNVLKGSARFASEATRRSDCEEQSPARLQIKAVPSW